jgi:hypothetical protein
VTRRARSREEKTLEVAERVAAILGSRGVPSAVIGAMALAVHGYVRATRDFDLATHVHPFLTHVHESDRLQS